MPRPQTRPDSAHVQNRHVVRQLTIAFRPIAQSVQQLDKGWTTEKPRFGSLSYGISSRRLRYPHKRLPNGYLGIIPRGVNPEPTFSAEVKNVRTIFHSPRTIFVARQLNMGQIHAFYFTFTLTGLSGC
jgi:hypothetical protein